MAKKTFETSFLPEETRMRSSMDKIKLCGYLRKKRNKVGGWRKLFFVLQDRLLVSYASKEEYDNKLVSFKDVLNLVPGTQVRPMDGSRFTIETTTQVIYTFHCDDHIAYREWIAMLMDSAGSMLNCSRRYFAHDPTKIRNYDLLNGAEHKILQNSTNEGKHFFNRNVSNLCISRQNARKPWSNETFTESQTLKKQIERMSISGNEEYRLLALTPDIEKHSRFKLLTTQNTEHSFSQLTKIEENAQNSESSRAEPVYAVVDLKNKYDQRKKRSDLIEGKRCNSYESIYRMERYRTDDKEKSLDSLVDGIYEDADLFFKSHGLLENSKNGPRETEENIYEPINVGQKTSMFKFRKYIERFKLNSFLRTPSTRTRTDTRIPSNSAMSRFSTLRWKLGKHRKSVQRRMRNLYSNEYEPNPLFKYQTEEIPGDCRTNWSAKGSDSNNEIIRNRTEKQSIKDSTKIQTEGTSTFRCENLQPLKKAVAKIPLFNISALKNPN